MDRGVLHKYAARLEPEATALDVDAVDDLGCFGWLRGVRERCLMLELRKKTGDIRAYGYAWLERVDFDPSEGITLWFAGQGSVRIRGSNLNAEVRPTVRLLDGLLRHRVPWVREASQAEALEAKEGACVVEKVE